jgi:hypothetical protein
MYTDIFTVLDAEIKGVYCIPVGKQPEYGEGQLLTNI